jgi:hypothetical protein
MLQTEFVIVPVVIEQPSDVAVTDELIAALTDDRGRLTPRGASYLGVPFPPPRGWRNKIIGKRRLSARPPRFITK